MASKYDLNKYLTPHEFIFKSVFDVFFELNGFTYKESLSPKKRVKKPAKKRVKRGKV